jgi:hypothetical protein
VAGGLFQHPARSGFGWEAPSLDNQDEDKASTEGDNLLVLLHPFVTTGVTPEAISKTPWAMHALRFRDEPTHHVIVHHLRTQVAVFFRSMALPARLGSCHPKDYVTVRV